MARGTPTWRTSSRRARRWRSSTAIFRHAVGYEGLPDLRGGEDVRPRRAADRGRVRAQLPAARSKEIRKAQRVIGRSSKCWTTRSRGGAGAPRAAATARRGRRLDRATPPRQEAPCRITSRGRGRWPSRSRTSPTSTRSRALSDPGHLVLVHEHAAVRASPPTGSRTGSIYRFRLRPLTRAEPDRPAPFAVGEDGVRRSTASSTPRERDGRRAPRATGDVHDAGR